jgi:multiple sugar transport system permease protein
MFPAPIAKARPAIRVAYGITLPASLVLWLLPLFGVALTSVRSLEEIARGEIWRWPAEINLVENYTAVFANSPMVQYLLNSFAITIPAVIGTIALASMAGFAIAKLRIPGAAVLLALFIAGNFVPFQILMIPVRSVMIDTLALYDTRWALILFHIAFQTGFATLFMRNFIKRLPDSLIETARVEGMGELRIFWYVILPLVRPALAGISVLIFTFVWNDYFWSLVLVHSDDVRPVTAGVQTLRGMWVSSWHLVSAASIVAALPPVLLFFLMQRQFVAGLTLGATEE